MYWNTIFIASLLLFLVKLLLLFNFNVENFKNTFKLQIAGEITLICLGPLTNLALALRLDPMVALHLKELYIIGGNIEGE